MWDTKFDPKKHTHKYFCHTCNIMWFGKNQFEDLCPNCEDIDFTFSIISETDIEIYNIILQNITGFERCIEDMKRESSTLSWKIDDNLQHVV